MRPIVTIIAENYCKFLLDYKEKMGGAKAILKMEGIETC
jgi:hypothetical protein